MVIECYNNVSNRAQSVLDLVELPGAPPKRPVSRLPNPGKLGREILPEELAIKTPAFSQSPVRGLNHLALYFPLDNAPERAASGQSFSKYKRNKSCLAVRAQ